MALRLSRRTFAGVAGAALASAMAGCDRRAALGPDLRAPSAPTGLRAEVRPASVNLVWDVHPLTDFTGGRTETKLTHHVYRGGVRLTTDPLEACAFEDPVSLTGITVPLVYTVTAVDSAGNESLHSLPRQVGRVNVFSVRDARAATGTVFDPLRIREMVFAAVRECAGLGDTGAAFQSFFPGLHANSTIGIKVNTLAGSRLSSHPEVAEAVVDGLALMLGGTFPKANVTIFDDRDAPKMQAARYVLRETPSPYRCVSTYSTDGGTWSATVRTIGHTPQRLSKLAESLDFIVNLPVLKDHNVAGVTFALKNLYGLVSDPGLMHGNQCDPMISEIYSLVRHKVRLVIGDAVYAAHNNGPDTGPTFAPMAVYAGTDPVAMDLHALSIINAERARRNLSIVGSGPTDAARHIATAGSPAFSLGELYSSAREIVMP